MSNITKTIFFFSDIDSSKYSKEKLGTSGYIAIFSSDQTRLSEQIAALKPVALVFDCDYCKKKSLRFRGFLERMKKEKPDIPIFLINAPIAEFSDLLVEELVYSVIEGVIPAETLVQAVSACHKLQVRRLARTPLRYQVTLPCLVKRIGSSGVVHGHICDISPNGMKVVLDQDTTHWSDGDELRFSLLIAKRLPASEPQHLDGYGHVRWNRVETNLSSTEQIAMGIEFGVIPTQTRVGVMQILNTARSTPATPITQSLNA